MKRQSTTKPKQFRSPRTNTAEKKRKFRLVIADGNPLCRRGLLEFLREDGRFEILAEADQGEVAFQTILELKPDAAVLEATLPGVSGIEVAALLKARNCETPLIILASNKDEKLFNQAINVGIRGFVMKRNPASEIVNCIAATASGGAYVCPLLTDFLLRRHNRTDSLSQRLGHLTVSERQILNRVAQGKTSREIATESDISPRTVDSHRANICEKLGLSGSHRLLQFALEHRDALGQVEH